MRRPQKPAQKVVKWDAAPVEGTQVWESNLFYRTVPDELIHLMRLNPGVLYRLLDEAGNPVAFTKSDVAAMANGGKPYRVVSRQIRADKNQRQVWVGFDPAYAEDLKKKREQKAGRK